MVQYNSSNIEILVLRRQILGRVPSPAGYMLDLITLADNTSVLYSDDCRIVTYSVFDKEKREWTATAVLCQYRAVTAGGQITIREHARGIAKGKEDFEENAMINLQEGLEKQMAQLIATKMLVFEK